MPQDPSDAEKNFRVSNKSLEAFVEWNKGRFATTPDAEDLTSTFCVLQL